MIGTSMTSEPSWAIYLLRTGTQFCSRRGSFPFSSSRDAIPPLHNGGGSRSEIRRVVSCFHSFSAAIVPRQLGRPAFPWRSSGLLRGLNISGQRFREHARASAGGRRSLAGFVAIEYYL